MPAPQIAGWADTGAQQDLRRPVRAGAQDYLARDDTAASAVDDGGHGNATAMPAGDLDAFDESVAAHREVGTVADRVEICERAVPAGAARRVDRADGDSGPAIEVQQVVPVRDPG